MVGDVGQGGSPFVLAPFRGLRFDANRVGDLGTVISPPYDVLDAETVRDLEAANRRNIVRLILSRRFKRPYLAVRRRLERWRDEAYLRADDDPSLYLYQYTVDRVTVRGLIGVVALREEADGVILPHEDVMAAPVEDRAMLMRTTESNLEPILLVHQGTDLLRALLETEARHEPTLTFDALDHSRHSLWTITDPESQARLADALGGTRALIADGHHRYAAYLRLQREMRDPAVPPEGSPWDFGLAFLVDQRDYPLHIGPIHRSVSEVTMNDVEELCADRGDSLERFPDREAAFADQRRVADQDDRATFVVSDGRLWARLSTARSHDVDAAVLHEDIFSTWQIAEEQVGYHHSLDQALSTTVRQPGIVIAVQPPTLDEVMQTAAHGIRMPRKSTSFSPKPRVGVVMRDLGDA